MPEVDALTITIVFIILSTFVAAFVRGRKRDKCLRDFAGYMVTLEDVSGKTIWGRLRVENTGLELVYSTRHEDKDGHIETVRLDDRLGIADGCGFRKL